MKPFYQDLHNTIYCIDFRKNDLPDECVQMVCTSPPYWGLRKFSGDQELIWGDKDCEHQWITKEHRDTRGVEGSNLTGRIPYKEGEARINYQDGFCSLCGAWKGAYGLEPTPEMYIEHTIEILREIRRVLRKDGVCFWNLGDSYYGSGGDHKEGGKNDAGFQGDLMRGVPAKQQKHSNLKPKDLCLIPFRVAISAQEDGWWVRSVIIWNKPNPMPESVHGSHFIRHCVTIEEYERLQSLRTAKGNDQDGANDLPGMPPSKVSDSEETLPAEQEGASDSKEERGTSGCDGETPSSQSGTASEAEQGKTQTNKRGTGATEEKSQSALLPDNEGQIQEATRLCETEAGDSAQPTSDRRGLARDTESSQEPMSLLPQEESSDDRPCDTNQQGREAYEGEHGASLSELQRQEKGQSGDALIECPGCPKCKAHNGYIRIKGSGRPTESHEYILMLTKSADYFFDTDAVREPHKEPERGQGEIERYGEYQPNTNDVLVARWTPAKREYNPLGRNIRSVWEFPTQPYPEAHFAVFPEKLPEICIKASTPEVGCCSKCGSPWERVLDKKPSAFSIRVRDAKAGRATPEEGYKATQEEIDNYPGNHPDPGYRQTTGWQPTCKCNADKVPSIILDPFAGAGTTLWVAKKLNRQAVGYEISEEYCRLAADRSRQQVLL